MPLEEATISNMWEIVVIVEVLERKGLRTKQDLYDVITEFRRKNSLASIPETVFPSGVPAHRNREQDYRRHPGTTQYARADFAPVVNLLERLGKIIEMGQRVTKGTTH